MAEATTTHSTMQERIEEATAQAIFADWEEFARYGFNKSHAADYGVIAVETAYLKAHYPAEYMAALLSSAIGDTASVVVTISGTTESRSPSLYQPSSRITYSIP